MSRQEAFLEPILRTLRLNRVRKHIPRNVTVLDIGCGVYSTFLKHISPYIRQGIGVDFKVAPIKDGNIHTIQARLDDILPFDNNTFEVVTMLAVLEHIEYEQEIIKEIKRVLIPGGKLILTVPSVWSQPVLEFLAYRLKVVNEAEIRDHKRYYNRERLKQSLVIKGGFEEFRHQYFQLWMNNFCIVVKGS